VLGDNRFLDAVVTLAKIPNRTDYVDLVYTSLRDAISDGTLPPGERITQEDLAARLNVSRSPVLQALRLLKKDGLLEEAPGRGLIVTRLDPDRIGHLYQVRGALDGLAARLAAQRQQKIPMVLIERGRQVTKSTDIGAMIEADMAFHRAIYEASGNPLIAENALLHWVHFRLLMGAVLQQSASRQGIWDEHQAIAQAINDGNGTLAAKLSEQHAEAARLALVGHLKVIHSGELLTTA
jgi:DNA-binding GntR family transcriptional regulator